MDKYIFKKGERPINAKGEANLSNGDFWIIDEEQTIIDLLIEIRDELKKE
jgi:hypothetical protein